MNTVESIQKDFYFLNDTGEMATLIKRYDWSKTALGSPDQWPVSLRVQLSMMLKSRFPMLIFWGKDLITFYNDAFRPSLGQDGKHPSSLGQRGEVSWAESWPTIGPMIQNIMRGGDAVWFEDQKLPIYRDGKMGYAYWTYSFSPLINDAGSVNGILVTCSETTKAVESIEKLADSEQRFRSLIEEAPVAATLFRGPDNVIEVANKLTQRYWGKGPEIVGKPLAEAAPELASQQMIELMAAFYKNGGTMKFEETPLTFVENGVSKEGYYTHTWKALHDNHGKVDGILAIGVDVSEQVLSRKKIEASEARFRSLIEEAPVATCLFTGKEMIIELANDLMLKVWGKDSSVIGMPLKKAVPELQGQPFLDILDRVFASGKAHSEAAARAELKVDGVLGTYYFNYTYKPLLNEAGQVYGIMDMAVDVTEQVLSRQALEELQHEQRMFLEQQVMQRTEELATAIKQLKITNDELEDSNIRLLHSNEELSQFAYIASHDLQEPLRKISTFSDMLRSSLGNNVSDTTENYLTKIKSSSNRMARLITDILNYSKFVKDEQRFEPVDLNDILKNVVTEFDLLIEQKNAKVEVAELSVIDAIPLQMTQLFRNLIGNALKFTKKDVKPEIRISQQPLCEKDFNERTLSAKNAYCKIEVLDNGIGIPSEYEDKIFSIFKRLHAKTEYEGTGIGLAMCKKIALNHGGDVYVTGGGGRGAAFYVILPLTQNKG